jgi:methyl-accepting chemotaxis protein
MTLRKKILVTLILVGLLPATIVAVFSVSTSVVSLEEDAFNQLKSVREIKKASVERYLNTILDQVDTLAENGSVVSAMAGFKSAFDSISSEPGAPFTSVDDLRRKAAQYYNRNFIPTLKAEVPNTNISAEDLTQRLSMNTLLLQEAYIFDNPNPVGEKHLLNKMWTSSYNTEHQKVHPFLMNFLERFGFYDIFLIEPESGHIVYSVFKEVDYGTSLKTGPYASSGLARSFKLALSQSKADRAEIIDFSTYVPSYEAPAGFLSSPIFDENNQLVGVLAFQFPIAALNAIMGERTGLGQTGESYLVGPDQLMRSDSYLDPVKHSVVASFKNPESAKVSTDATKKALKGEDGVEIIIDYNGNPVLSAYAPLKLAGINWGILAEIDEAEALAPSKRLIWLISIVMLISAIAIVSAALVFARSIMRPLGSEPAELEVIAGRIASGDLSIQTDDQTATGVLKSMLDMAKELREMVGQILKVSNHQSVAAEELSAITNESNQTITRQRESTEMVATAMTEMAATVTEVSQNTVSASDNAKATREKLSTNVREVGAVSDDMHIVSSELQTAKDKIDSLNQSTEDIATILTSITNIADQTNLLALNAAIEAARAGEQGRGFAVVADEVRSLAQNTQESTEQISSMISRLKTQSGDVNKVIQKSLEKANETSRITVTTAQNIMEVLTSVESIDDTIFQIAGASEEQATVADDISQRVVEISDMSMQTSDASMQIKTASEELAQLSHELQAMVTHFKLD